MWKKNWVIIKSMNMVRVLTYSTRRVFAKYSPRKIRKCLTNFPQHNTISSPGLPPISQSILLYPYNRVTGKKKKKRKRRPLDKTKKDNCPSPMQQCLRSIGNLGLCEEIFCIVSRPSFSAIWLQAVWLPCMSDATILYISNSMHPQ